MEQRSDLSNYDLLRGKATFEKKEKPWLRLVVFSIIAIFWFGVFWMLKQWAIPFLAVKGIAGFNLSGLWNSFKGRSP